MSSTDSYKPGDLKLSHYCTGGADDDAMTCTFGDACPKQPQVFHLPHQCDGWVIGGIEEARVLLRELQELIAKAVDDG